MVLLHPKKWANFGLKTHGNNIAPAHHPSLLVKQDFDCKVMASEEGLKGHFWMVCIDCICAGSCSHVHCRATRPSRCRTPCTLRTDNASLHALLKVNSFITRGTIDDIITHNNSCRHSKAVVHCTGRWQIHNEL